MENLARLDSTRRNSFKVERSSTRLDSQRAIWLELELNCDLKKSYKSGLFVFAAPHDPSQESASGI